MNRPLPLHGVLPAPVASPRWAVGGKGFRPFFLMASLFAILIVPLWLLVLSGVLAPNAYLEPVAWHAHEMVFGYASAVIAGFLLTAVASWTQRETLVGVPLLALAGLWALGRAVMAFPSLLPRGAVALIDVAFLPMLAIAIARPLIAARNRRNFVMLAVLAVLVLANLTVHLEALGALAAGAARHAILVALDVIVLLMLVVAGRVIPMFTRNGLGATTTVTIASNALLDRLTAVAAVALLAVDLVDPRSIASSVVAGILAIIATARAARWGWLRTGAHPLLWILHAGYAWIPVGLLLRAASLNGALHALTVGALGTLTLGMMTRVTLGHTGRALVASRPMKLAFMAITAAAFGRVFLPLVTSRYVDVLLLAGGLWTVAFVLYLVACAPALVSRRVDAKVG